MGIEHYAFAFFVSVLICLIAVLLKVLFANVKRQNKMLDEKETKLLQLYQSIEGIMEEFADQVNATTKELKEYEDRVAKRAIEASTSRKPPEVRKNSRAEKAEKPMRGPTLDDSRLRVATEVIERAERVIKGDVVKPPVIPENGSVFQRFFDDTISEMQTAEEEVDAKQKRNETILAMVKAGKTNSQIAEELGITQNEVKFIIELGRVR